MTALYGANLLAREESASGSQSFQAIARATGEPLKPPYAEATEDEIDRAGTLAADCVGTLADQSPARIGELLEALASEIEALGEELIERAAAETAFPADRLKREPGSVGAAAIQRFARPICFQVRPVEFLPPELHALAK